MKILVTGASGFTGMAMVQYLVSEGDQEIYGLVNTRPQFNEEKFGLRFVKGNLLNRKRLQEIIHDIRPEIIIHCAGLNKGTLDELLATNAVGTQNLLDSVHMEDIRCRTVVVSSSAVYGYSGTNPIKETAALHPQSAYGISKAAQELVALREYAINKSQVTLARPFNLVGPGLPSSFVCGGIVSQIARIEAGKQDTLHLRELVSKRDFIDVRDVIRAYWALADHPRFTRQCAGKIFNIGSGKAYAIAEVIRILEELLGKSYEISLPGTSPPISILSQKSNNDHIQRITKWLPDISLETSLKDMLIHEQKQT
jgi:GDP-4-dehydro-6-deoxy-D-mannose reductase